MIGAEIADRDDTGLLSDEQLASPPRRHLRPKSYARTGLTQATITQKRVTKTGVFHRPNKALTNPKITLNNQMFYGLHSRASVV